jgi:hypothetical protein
MGRQGKVWGRQKQSRGVGDKGSQGQSRGDKGVKGRQGKVCRRQG